LFVWDHSAVSIAVSNKYLQVYGVSQDEAWLAGVAKFIKGEMAPAVERGHIFAIVRAGNGYQLNPIGDASVPLESGNYTPSVIENYRFIIRDLSTSTPSGRIVILEGEPGTGKTHLIRALLNDVGDGMFVLVSPDMVPSLTGPDILPTLINTKTSYNIKGPIVLVLEDADRCLVRREGDNMSFIQSLLNLGDGILGSMLDLRILATTNAKKLDMEGAILRPGRLSRRMEVGPLDLETARLVFNRLLPNTTFPQLENDGSTFGFRNGSTTSVTKMTLAEVYGLARKHGWEPKAVEVEDLHSEYKLEELFENSEDDDDDDE
jgi:SpoVK/Ycf46/Vps4 family AAA+-type ATPase